MLSAQTTSAITIRLLPSDRCSIKSYADNRNSHRECEFCLSSYIPKSMKCEVVRLAASKFSDRALKDGNLRGGIARRSQFIADLILQVG